MYKKEKLVIGIDPDSKAHGVAVYQSGRLVKLKSMALMEVIDYIKTINKEFFTVSAHIEDVKGNSSSSFHCKPNEKRSVKAKKSENVGMCKQSQAEIERAFSYYGIPFTLHKISSRWKDTERGKSEFTKATGWTKQSNEDTRSAAYFGMLGVK